MDAVLLFDGDCGFCTSSIAFMRRHVPTRTHAVPWQRADLATLGVSRPAAEEAVLWVAGNGDVFAGPDAISRLLRDAGGGWRALGVILGASPVRQLAWPAYRWIARHRHRLPGGTAACAVNTQGN